MFLNKYYPSTDFFRSDKRIPYQTSFFNHQIAKMVEYLGSRIQGTLILIPTLSDNYQSPYWDMTIKAFDIIIRMLLKILKRMDGSEQSTTPPILESFLEMGPSSIVVRSIQWYGNLKNWHTPPGSVQLVAVKRCPKIYDSVHHYLHSQDNIVES